MIVFDLDGTLALDDHRNHLLKGETKKWDEYFDACHDDDANLPIVRVALALHEKRETLGLWTGRSARVQTKTWQWLRDHNLYFIFDQFRMRSLGDHTDDHILKAQWLAEQQQTSDPVTLVFEDRQRVVDMWRAHGIPCCQVAPGAF